MNEEIKKDEPVRPRQASLAECLAFSRKTDLARNAEADFITAEQERARLNAEDALRRIRQGQTEADSSAEGGPQGAPKAPVSKAGADGATSDTGAPSTPTSEAPTGVDWKPFADEQLVGMAASIGIDPKVHDGNREMLILALEEKGFVPSDD